MRAASEGDVRALRRAVDVLQLVADRTKASTDVSLTELATSSELPVATIHRLLRTLAATGLLRQLPSKRYALGPRLLQLGQSASNTLGAWARPHLTELADACGESANMAMLDGDHVIYVAHVPSSQHSMRMFTEVGRQTYVHTTGVGKVLLAELPADDVDALISRVGLPPRTDRTITDGARFATELAKVRRDGYAVDDGEEEIGVRCVAVALPGGPTRAAISVSGPAGRMTHETIMRTAPLLQRTANRLAKTLATN